MAVSFPNSRLLQPDATLVGSSMLFWRDGNETEHNYPYSNRISLLEIFKPGTGDLKHNSAARLFYRWRKCAIG
jgi:hypothetical protein